MDYAVGSCAGARVRLRDRRPRGPLTPLLTGGTSCTCRSTATMSVSGCSTSRAPGAGTTCSTSAGGRSRKSGESGVEDRSTMADIAEVDLKAGRGPLDPEELDRIDAYWRAANYLSVGQIYLLDNPLLREPLRPEHVKPRLLGHWGTTPGLNFVYVHMNRVIKREDLDAIYITGPGPRRPGAGGQRLPGGNLQRGLPDIGQDEEGLRRLFRQFSFPGGIPSHVAPETPGLDQRGRRARLLPGPRLRRRLRQPRPGGLLRGRRRRGRDGPAGGQLALEQVPQPGHATAPCCRSCT